MSSTIPLRNATDAYVTSKRPELNRSGTNRLLVSAGGDGNTHRAFIFHTLPFPSGTNVLDSKFRFTTDEAATGSVTFTIAPITEKWNASKIRWSKQPAVNTAVAKSITKTAPTAGTEWEFNVTDILQSASTSGTWFGFRITVNTNGQRKIYSSQASSNLRPELEVTWTDAPEAPEEIYPAGGRAVGTAKPILSFDFVDEAGDTELNAVQVQFATDSSEVAFETPTWDSGILPASKPEVDLALITVNPPPALTSAITWWRVRVQDGAGLWSDWSDAESMRYVPAAGVTIDSPGGAPNNFVTDATPPILWTVTGSTQTAWRILISDAAAPANEFIWDSGKFSDNSTAIALPKKVLTRDDITYRLTLMVWDDVNREKNGIFTVPSYTTRDFTFVESDAITKVTNVIATQQSPWPWVDIEFDHTQVADEYNIWRDGVLIEENIPVADLQDTGTHFVYRDRVVSPRVPHYWQVQAVVNGVTGKKMDSNTITTRLLAPMMMELNGTNPVFFLNPKVDPQSMTAQERHQPINGAPVLITQYMAGYEGKVEGVFADNIFPNVTARQMRNQFKAWKKTPGKVFYFYLIDEVMKIVPYNMDYRAVAKTEGVLYTAWFDFFEVD
jgi:hypothetical protein